MSKDNKLNLSVDEDVAAFSDSQVDLEGATDNLFSSQPHPQPLRFEILSLKTPQTGMALQQ